MPSLKDSSELHECAALLQLLLPPGGVADYQTFDQPKPGLATEQGPGQDLLRTSEPDIPRAAASQPPQVAAQHAAPLPDMTSGHKEDMLENALQVLCHRGGFTSAVIADDQGLALADYNSPVDTEVLAAFATVLGGAIAQASHFLDQHEANNISMDINYADKAVVRKFEVRATPFYLFIICPQDIDERNEVELSLDTIKGLLNR